MSWVIKKNIDLDQPCPQRNCLLTDCCERQNVVPGQTMPAPGASRVVPSTSEAVPGQSMPVPGASRVVPSTSEAVPGQSMPVPGASRVVPSTYCATGLFTIGNWCVKGWQLGLIISVVVIAIITVILFKFR